MGPPFRRRATVGRAHAAPRSFGRPNDLSGRPDAVPQRSVETLDDLHGSRFARHVHFVARVFGLSPQLHETHRAVRERVLRRFVVLRAFVAPFVALIGVGFMLSDPAPWRVAVISSAAVFVAGPAIYEAIVHRSTLPGETRVGVTLFMTGLAQLAVAFGAGGLASPVVPALLLFALMTNVFAPVPLGILLVGTLQIPALWVFAYVQWSGVIPGYVPPIWSGMFASAGSHEHGPFLAAGLYTVMACAMVILGRSFRETIDEMVRRSLEDKDRALALHADAARALTSLSAEIAHELKNPLASIKGLSALLRRDLEGVPLERLDVMRREIDRMQAVLDEFLTFSRPLVPLDPSRVDVRALVEEVASLHEGVAAEGQVTMIVDVPSTLRHRCDPRKTKQILINLVQNALDASAPRSTIVLRASATAERLTIEIVDEGSGLERDAEQLFDVGMTTKPTGNGLGLAIARGLARQHDGDVRLAARTDGPGTIAVIELGLPTEEEPHDARPAA